MSLVSDWTYKLLHDQTVRDLFLAGELTKAGLPPELHQIHVGDALRCVLLNTEIDTSDLRRVIVHPSTQPTAVIVGNRRPA